MKSLASMIKNIAGPSFIIVATIFIFSATSLSRFHTVAATQGEDNIIQLGVVEQQEVYRWSDNSGAINPTLKFIVNTDNIVQIQNPTDEEHEMIIESQPGNELTTSGDIVPNGSGELSFRPNMTGTFQYHCEYHPATMKGIVEISGG
jgi:plastocyanin